MKEKELTPKEEAFCVAFTAVGSRTFNNATQSAIEAKYAKNSARTQAWRMLKRERIRERIRELYQTAFDENMVTPASVLANVRHDRNMAREQGNYSVAVKCDELEGKYLALWTDNINQTQQPEIEPLSDEEREFYLEVSKEIRRRQQIKLHKNTEKASDITEAGSA